MHWTQLVRLARELPDVEEGIWFRTPALLVRGKSFTRLKEDGATVVFLVDDVDEQELLIATKPRTYFITDHYRGFPAVLTRLARLTAAEARPRLERAWRRKAPRTLVRKFDEAAAGGAET
jgi:hypothetical protein